MPQPKLNIASRADQLVAVAIWNQRNSWLTREEDPVSSSRMYETFDRLMYRASMMTREAA